MIRTQAIYNPLYTDRDKFVILITGGRGSGKSFNASAFIERLTFQRSDDRQLAHTVLYTRYTMVSAHISIIPEMMEKIELDGTARYFRSTKADIVNLRSGGRIMFRGIKTSSGNQTAKLKSIHGITTFVCDEAEEWTSEQDFDKIMLSIRQKGIQNRIIIIMNPTDSNHFIYRKYIAQTHRLVEVDGVPVQISTHPSVLHIHTTYLDNLPHLSDEFLREVRQMKEDNPEKYAHTVIGRWADVAEGAVFKRWGVVEEFPRWCKKVALGLDFGYSQDPTAAVRCGVIDNRLYLDEVDYRTGLVSSDIIRSLRPWQLNVYADSADPRLIQEIRNGGINIYPAEKGPGSVLAGIDKMKDMELFVTARSYNLQRELRQYVWERDKDGNYVNQPADRDNHCFTGETMIETLCGSKRIDTISVGDYVLTSNGYQRVSKFFDIGCRKILHIKISFRYFVVEIKATPEHKFKTTRGWKQLKDLTRTDVLYTCKSLMGKSIVYTMENGISLVEQNGFTEKIAAQSSVAEVVAENMLQASEIKKIEIVSEEVANVYDLEVENMHEFFANGVLVHNCVDAARYYVLSVLLGRVRKPRDYSGIFSH